MRCSQCCENSEQFLFGQQKCFLLYWTRENAIDWRGVALSEEEKQIGKRIRVVRKEHGVSQRLAAAQMGLSRQQLDRIERGEVAIRLGPALRFCEFTNRNPLWLAFGEPQNRFGFFWPREKEAGSWEIVSVGGDWTSDQVVAEAASKDATLLQTIRRHRERFPKMTSFFATSNRDPRWSAGPAKPIGALFLGGRDVNYQLTSPGTFSIVSSMNLRQVSFWPSLRERIQRFVRERGMKSALARDIGITRQAVNALLNEKYVPAGEQMLKLSKWVDLAEAQQKQSAGVSEARPAPKTRERKSKHEKPSSDRKKK